MRESVRPSREAIRYPSFPQLTPRARLVSQRGTGAPLLIETLASFPSAVNASHWPSGENVKYRVPVGDNGTVLLSLKLRVTSDIPLSERVAYAMRRPSGESCRPKIMVSANGQRVTGNRIS